MTIIIDTGPLYAFFDRNDQWYDWSLSQFSSLKPPFITCEAVLSETIFLLNRTGINANPLFELMNRNLLIVKPIIHKRPNQMWIQNFIRNYHNLPASFADSCMMHLAEHERDSYIFTLDSDFTIYRDGQGNPPNLINPEFHN